MNVCQGHPLFAKDSHLKWPTIVPIQGVPVLISMSHYMWDNDPLAELQCPTSYSTLANSEIPQVVGICLLIAAKIAGWWL
jgi:hypothetical protein